MKIRIAIISLICVALAACNHSGNKPIVKKHKTDWDDNGLKGRVKSWIEKDYSDTGRVDKALLLDEYDNTFDSIGNELEDYEHYPKGESFRTVNIYNNKGQCIISKEYIYNGTDTSKMTTLHTYNSKGDLTEDNNDSNTVGPTMRYIYDSVGNLKAFYAKNQNDTCFVINESFKYDSNGNVVESDYYFPSGLLQSRDVDIFNKDGKRIRSEIYYDNDSAVSIEGIKHTGSGEFDENGHRIGWVEYNHDGSVKMKYVYKNTCDKQGNIVKKEVFKNGKPYEYAEFEIVYY